MSWTMFFIIMILLVLFLVIFYGDRDAYRFIGISPLNPNTDATQYFTVGESSIIYDDDSEAINEDITFTEEDSSLYDVSRVITPNLLDIETISQSIESRTRPIAMSQPFGSTVAVQNSSVGSSELDCCHILEDIFQLPFPKNRPTFLQNPETRRNLEIDCYNASLPLGLEYQGDQHYKYPNHWHREVKDFVSQLRRDDFKYRRCQELGVPLIIVPYNIPAKERKNFIISQIPAKLLKSSAYVKNRLNAS